MSLVKGIYISVSEFPVEERYGLTSQIKRSAVSIPSNIAEGSGRGSDKEFARFLGIALASSYELETQLILSNDLDLLRKDVSDELFSKLNEVQKMTFSLQRKLSKS